MAYQQDETTTGLLSNDEVFDLDIADDELVNSFAGRIRASQSFWEVDRKLKSRREKMERYWEGQHDLGKLYEYQVPNKFNRVYMHTEHIVQTVNARLPDPIVTARQNREESRKLAQSFGSYIFAHANNHRWKDYFRIATRNLLLQFQGVIKIRWDDMAGPISSTTGMPMGDVVIDCPRPSSIIVDQYARPFTNPSFVAEVIQEPLYITYEKFPKKKNAIRGKLGSRSEKKDIGTWGYYEVHCSYLTKEGIPREAVVWFSPELDLVLGKMKSPNWDEDGHVNDKTGERTYRNLLDRPLKPYAFLTMNNLGKYFIDETTPIEQFLPIQDVINARSQQIMDHLVESKGGRIWSRSALTKEEAAKVTNDPEQSVVVAGDVRAAVTRLPMSPLDSMVLQDKIDARNEGDNIVGVHGPTRGEREGSDKPTSLQLLKEGDFQRRSDLINGLERLAEYTYQYAAHLMKLNYTEEHWEAIEGESGQRTFISLTQDRIEDGLEITVKAGTTLPTDQLTQREEAMELMRLGKIDYITFFERLGFPDPKEQAKKLYQHENNPQGLYEAADEQEEAAEDIERLVAGEQPVLPDQVSEAYLGAVLDFMKSARFNDLDEDKKAGAAAYIQQVIELARQGAVGPNEPPPSGPTPGPAVQPRPQTGILGRMRKVLGR